ncbi:MULTISPECIES: virA/G regulated protein [unclassified Rhizobium]|uniref:VirA/G regulated protein n=2 Tax=Rhizobium tumorigenes TaxID=2041385 RepID=A0AAF1KA00_9HYPH|nr:MULTISPECIES: virA/G regulated protein [Rhizobium]MBO9101846.1 virA/G regulated protein [Rhizobium sp. L58/93]MBO9172017.1 virA/G regulated protein [Rhizobium sp. L245/93]MBO9187878.1 virA/G regulated protein [Rhizobium sp. E27B/91]QXZ87704.1 virA/G regulated protein [Rhizobium sp. K1/93]QXZ93744.1 virA/G regulated protein [Rhizobium sp. K15/93]
MNPPGNSKIGLTASARSSLDVHAGVTPVLRPTDSGNRCAGSSSDGQTDHGEESSASFFYDGMRLGVAERSAYETWDGADRPTWRDLVLSARLNDIDSSAWNFDGGQTTSSVFVYEGVTLGEGERRAYEEWTEPGQPGWQELVVNARTAELHPSAAVSHERDPPERSTELRSDAPKRKRKGSIDQDESVPSSFYYDGKRLSSPEREVYDNWSKPEPPSWRDLIINARLDAIDRSAWLRESGGASVFEYEGIPLGEGERLAYESWLEPAQPGWEDLVVNTRTAELNQSARASCENESLEEGKGFSSHELEGTLGSPIDGAQDARASFVYDGVSLGAPERDVYENWNKPERPSWEDLILDARLAAVQDSSISSLAPGEASNSAFFYDGIALGNAELQAYARWRQPAQPRWQNLVVNARLLELDPSAWIHDEHDPFEEVEEFNPPSRSTTPSEAKRTFGKLDLNRPALRCEKTSEEVSQTGPLTRVQSEMRSAVQIKPSGLNAYRANTVASGHAFNGGGKVKRLGFKSHSAGNEALQGMNSGTKGLASDEGGQVVPPDRSSGPRGDNIGTYGSRRNERVRLATETGQFESEHIFGFKVVHEVLRRTKEGRRLERPMPAYLECKELHRQHVGTGRGRSGLVGRGWTDDSSYRSDQRATLSDPVASAEGATASNGYQLNQLGYAHQLAKDGLQNVSFDSVTMPIRVATTSYNYTVSRDPVLSPTSKEQEPPVLHLGPRGQTEAVLARETALTGQWPTRDREREVYREFLALYDFKTKLETNSLSVRQKRKALVSALDRTASLIGAAPVKALSQNAERQNTAELPDERREYDPRERGRRSLFQR